MKYLVEGVQYRYRDPAMVRAAECGIDLELTPPTAEDAVRTRDEIVG